MALFLFLICSTLFFTLIFGASTIQVFKQRLIISNRITDYFDIDENKKKPKKSHFEKQRLILLEKLSNRLKAVVARATPLKREKELENRLREAGYPFNLSPTDFLFLQIIIGVVFFFSVFILLSGSGVNLLAILFLAGIVAILGMYYPSFYLSMIIKKRRLEIQKKMPDFFDMVNLSIEAGMGLDASLVKVCHQIKGPLSDEFLQTLNDMKLGKSRREAFSDLRSRVPVHSFQSVITSLIQAEILGVGMAKILRSLTDRIREQRIQLAREQAMKAPVKIIFPMMFFIFPAIFIVMLGPLVIYLIQTVF